MSVVNIEGLRRNLEKRFKTMGEKKVQERAKLLLSEIKGSMKTVYKAIYRTMSNPASSRGYTKGKLNPHDSFSTNSGLPMLVTGALRASFHWYAKATKVKGSGVLITVDQGFLPVMNGRHDYGDVLNGTGSYRGHRVLKGFKERIMGAIEHEVYTLVRKKRFK